MSVIEFLASTHNRRDDKLNQESASKIIKSKHIDGIKELVNNLSNPDKNIQSDCIKVLYEIGEREGAELITPYYKIFGVLLKNRKNRLVWGAMTALNIITAFDPNIMPNFSRKSTMLWMWVRSSQ